MTFTLLRLGKFVRHWLGYLLDWLFWVSSRVLQKGLSSRLTLRKYCRLELNANASKYLQVPGTFGRSLETDTAFVPLLLDEGRTGEVTFSHTTIFRAGNRIQVIGDPGSGKSSLVKRLYRDACRDSFTSPKHARLPIRIELKEFIPPDQLDSSEELRDWGLSYIKDVTTSKAAFDMSECHESYRDTGGLLILLDGLDEVPRNAYARTAKLIQALSVYFEARTDKTTIILTMRTQFYRQISTDFEETFPTVLQIRSFSPNDIFQFLTQWPFGNQSASTEITRIYSDLTDRPTLREMCTNPLVLAMYVALDQHAPDPAALPETRTSFYSEVVEELLVRRRRRQLGAGSGRAALLRQREAILGRLAFAHLLDPDQPANSLSWEEAVNIAGAELKQNNRDLVEAYLRDLSKETGLFEEERKSDSLRFIHLTFCEFLAAQEAAEGREDGWRQLLNAHRTFARQGARQVRTRLIEVVPFTAGLLNRSKLDSALREVLALNDGEILARCFLETQDYDHPVWNSFSQQEVEALTSYGPDEWSDEWLARLHLVSVVLREAERWASSSGNGVPSVTSDELFHRLVGADEQKLMRVFSAYAAHDAAASFRLAEACGVDLVTARPDLLVEACSDPPFLALALDRAALDRHGETMWSSILAEAGLRFQVVATNLALRATLDRWRSAVAGLPKAERWLLPFRGQQSLYGDCLSIGCSREKRVPGQAFSPFPLVMALTFVPSVSAVGPVSTTLMATSVSAACFGLVFLFVWLATHSAVYYLATPVVVALYVAAADMFFYPRARRRVYLRLLNLNPFYSRLGLTRIETSRPSRPKSDSRVDHSGGQQQLEPVLASIIRYANWLSRALLHRQNRVALLVDYLREIGGVTGGEPLEYRIVEISRREFMVERSDGKNFNRARSTPSVDGRTRAF
jgi:hypothetical protein